MIEAKGETKNQNKEAADRCNIVYYTDPLCSWSWAFQPHWERFLADYRDRSSVRYCMGGMLESWKSYHDAENSVSKPIQMGPLWMQVGRIANVPIDSTIWVKDPPASSYLACTAVKCAMLQSQQTGEHYLQLLRTAVMLHGRNIAKQSVLIAIAKEMSTTAFKLDMDKFEADLVNGTGFSAFSADLQEVRYRNISRFPTLAISCSGRGVLLTGYQPYERLVAAIKGLTKEGDG